MMMIAMHQINFELSKAISVRVPNENTLLTKNMAENGLFNPIKVIHKGQDYIIVSGLLRYISAKALGWSEIKAYVIDTGNITLTQRPYK